MLAIRKGKNVVPARLLSDQGIDNVVLKVDCRGEGFSVTKPCLARRQLWVGAMLCHCLSPPSLRNT